MRPLFISVLFSITGVGAASGQAYEAEAASSFSLDSSAAVVSDYRYRGWSLSDESPALQFDATLAHDSGLYVGMFASSIEEYGVDADGNGAKSELDLLGGWAFSMAGFDIDAGAQVYFYPGASDVNYVVLPISVARSFGELSVNAGYEYTPRQTALGDTDGDYVWLGADWASETFPLWFSATIGREEGGFAPDGKTDWTLGAFHSLDTFDLGLTYTDTDEKAAGSALVAELRSHF